MMKNNALEDFVNPTDEFVRSIDVHTLLPQQEPFVMIGQIEHYDSKHVVTSLTINATNLFVDNGHFSASGLIENVAQTCAARIGYINKIIYKKGVQIGFIGAIKNLVINALPKVGETILTYVTVEEEIFGIILASAEVRLGDKVLLSTEMKIALKEEE